MRYLIVGAGGTGGAFAAFLQKAGLDVTLIARGEHLRAIREQGLRLELPESSFVVRPKAENMPSYVRGRQDGSNPAPDVILVCVKYYSLPETISFLRAAADSRSIIIPILNVYGTGSRMQAELPELMVTDGCMYIVSRKAAPGVIRMDGPLFRVVYGLRQDTPTEARAKAESVLEQADKELGQAGIQVVHSRQVEDDTFRKFTLISPMATLGAVYDTKARDMQPGGAHREEFAALAGELAALAAALGISLPQDIVAKNLHIIDHMAPDSTASMQRDVAAGRESEVDGLVHAVVRMADEAGIQVPHYQELAEILSKRGVQ